VEPLKNKKEFELKEIVDQLLFKKKLILTTIIVFFFFGILYIAFTQKEYTATLKILPESEQGNTGFLSRLGNIPGLNLGSQINQENVLSPELYPEIIQSNDFYLSLLNFKIKMGDDSLIVRDYVSSVYSPSLFGTIKKYTIGLPQLFRKSKAQLEESKIEDGITYLEGNDGKFIGWLNKRIFIETENATKILTISMESPDQFISAQLTNFTAAYLKSYLDDYQTQNDVRQLNFIEERRDEAKQDYLSAQQELAIFRDRNRNVMSEVSKIEEEVLVQEFNLTNRIYSSLAEQYEQANIKSKEKRVLFKVLEGVQLPAPQTKPQIVLILMLSIFTGIIFSVLYVLFPVIFKEFYE